ncbi:MAG: chromosomal replication initiator protein DnaA [bacterium]
MHEEVSSVWNMCLSQLSKRVKKHSFFTWLKPTRVEPIDDSSFAILVPNQFAADWIDEKYRQAISEALAEVSQRDWQFAFRICKPSQQPDFFEPEPEPRRTAATPLPKSVTRLNPRYLFDSFVVGDSNQFAYAACEAVAAAPGENRYNPLFIYGGVGLGKTHLVQAIGNQINYELNGHKILYATSEDFTNDFIRSLGSKSVHEFAQSYRSVDVLLLDDIQFFTGKESTQEQFFHTFNALHQAGKQIVLTADRPPRDILGLEERLLSRFSWGLVVDIQPPSLETRIAILQRKADSDGVKVAPEVLSYVADSITSNVRELEGALVRLLAFASLRNKDLTVAVAQEVLKDAIRTRTRQITIEQIQKKVAGYFKVSEELLKAKKKSQEIVQARQIAMYLCRTLTPSSLKHIGSKFGNRDHSTVIHACQQVSQNMKGSIEYKLQVDQLINLVCS